MGSETTNLLMECCWDLMHGDLGHWRTIPTIKKSYQEIIFYLKTSWFSWEKTCHYWGRKAESALNHFSSQPFIARSVLQWNDLFMRWRPHLGHWVSEDTIYGHSFIKMWIIINFTVFHWWMLYFPKIFILHLLIQ